MKRLGRQALGYALAFAFLVVALVVAVALMFRPAAVVAGVGVAAIVPDRERELLAQRLDFQRERNRRLRDLLRKRDRQISKLGGMVRAERAKRRRLAATPSSSRPGSIVTLGRWLQRRGYRVSEHPAFGGVEPVHRGRAHYEARAIDVNCDGCAGGEMAAIDRVVAQIRSFGFFVIWRSAGHWDHLHAETTR